MLIASCASAATWYVDDDNYGKTDLDGKTEASAFGTIKDALNNAGFMANDTVMVLPGVCSNDTMYVQGKSRVAINKTANLISRDGYTTESSTGIARFCRSFLWRSKFHGCAEIGAVRMKSFAFTVILR